MVRRNTNFKAAADVAEMRANYGSYPCYETRWDHKDLREISRAEYPARAGRSYSARRKPSIRTPPCFL
jgi:hypothetical protein